MQYEIKQGDCLEVLKTIPDKTIQTCISSPPYFALRDYEAEGQIGLEETPELFIQSLVKVYSEVKRVLKDDGTIWVNLGDSFGKGKQLLGIPWRFAFAMQANGWILRCPIIWHKPNAMPSSQTDRPTIDYELVFLMTKNQHYYYDNDSIREPHKDDWHKRASTWHEGKAKEFSRPSTKYDASEGKAMPFQKPANPLGRTKRAVWSVNTKPYPGAHFATYPVELIEPCVLAGSRIGDTVLDIFNGSGTTGEAALKHRRNYIGIELNPEYIKLTHERLKPIISTTNLFELLDEGILA